MVNCPELKAESRIARRGEGEQCVGPMPHGEDLLFVEGAHGMLAA